MVDIWKKNREIVEFSIENGFMENILLIYGSYMVCVWRIYGESMDHIWIWLIYPLVMANTLLLNMAIEIVFFSIKHGG